MVLGGWFLGALLILVAWCTQVACVLRASDGPCSDSPNPKVATLETKLTTLSNGTA